MNMNGMVLDRHWTPENVLKLHLHSTPRNVPTSTLDTSERTCTERICTDGSTGLAARERGTCRGIVTSQTTGPLSRCSAEDTNAFNTCLYKEDTNAWGLLTRCWVLYSRARRNRRMRQMAQHV